MPKEQLGSPRRITISTVIEEWNIGEVERLVDWCGEQGSVFAVQSAQMEKMPNLALLRNPRYQALVDKIIERRRSGMQPINGTPRTIETLLRFRDFECYPTMFPRLYPNGDVFILASRCIGWQAICCGMGLCKRYLRAGRVSMATFLRVRASAIFLEMCCRTITWMTLGACDGFSSDDWRVRDIASSAD